MKWVILIARTLVGLAFVAAGLTFFFSEMPQPENPSEEMKAFGTAMVPTRYMTVVKVLELVGGALLLAGVLVPVGVTILTPVIVNILLFELLIAKQPGPGIVLTLLSALLVYGYWPYFRSVFTVRARVGGDRV
jgi:putative oxidoreductase